MKLYPEKQAIVLHLSNPNRVLTTIPTARQLPLNGGHYVAVPHRVDETRLLNNLGAGVDSPILHYYTWPGRFAPFDAQRHTAAMLTLHRRAYVLNEVGTGKSMSVLWAYDYLRSQGEADKMLVIAPLSTLERTWADEIFHHLPHLNFSVLHGTKSQRLKALKAEADVYIINHDGVSVILDELQQRTDITHVVIDELSHVARNARTKKWRALNTVVNTHQRAAWGLTGTPTPNSPTDAWAQSRLITPERAPRSFIRFRDSVMRQYGPYKWVPKDDAIDTVKDLLSPAVRYTRDECLDLPECMSEHRDVALTAQQEKAYKTMVTQLTAEVDRGEVIAVNEAVKVNKLLQIACGAVYTTDGEQVTLDASTRLNALLEVIDATDHKVIVFVPFVSTISLVADFLDAQGRSNAVIHGGVAKSHRDVIFHGFQHDPDPRILVAQPAAMSHGLTLTAANVIVWYGPTTNNETYEQANGRITRPGQRNAQFIIHLEGTPIERRIYQRLEQKQSTQGVLLDLVKRGRLT